MDFSVLLDKQGLCHYVLSGPVLRDLRHAESLCSAGEGLCFIAYGLPGFSVETDAIVFRRKVAEEVSSREGKVTVAITSGMAFCGVVGHPLRRDYTSESDWLHQGSSLTNR
ncbi:hypothetical protein MTO96_044996 [Rhipicephalus appendiculatus]